MQSIQNPIIHKRTFEGININVITSEYMRSKKYAVSYSYNDIEQSPRTFTTKKEAEEWIDSKIIKMVMVPQQRLDDLEKARLALYDLLAPQLKAPIAKSFSFQVQLQEITQPMWYLSNRKWEEAK